MNTEQTLTAFAEDKASHYPIHQYAIVSPKEIRFSDDVLAACKQNFCGKYGRCWTCPPGVGDAREIRKKMLTYDKCFVYTTKHEIEDSFDVEGMAEGARIHSQVDFEIRKFIESYGTEHLFAGAGSCLICEKCTYPDAPCRHPELARPSMEASGINVVEFSRRIGINYINGANTVTYFSMILF